MLVEGDDTNEPVSDAVRGILDGHIVLDRAIAERGRFPAVDVLRSISRTAPGCYAPDERALVREARRLMRLHADMAELIRLGAYRAGSDAELDRAIAVQPALERVLEQDAGERSTSEEAFAGLAAALAAGDAGASLMRRAIELLARLERHALDEQRLALAAARGRARATAGGDRRARAAPGDRARPGLRAAGRAAAAGGLCPGGPGPGRERCATRRPSCAEAVGRGGGASCASALRRWKALDLVGEPSCATREARRRQRAARLEVEEAARCARPPAQNSGASVTSRPSSAGPNLIWQDSRELSRTSNASSSIMLSSELAASSRGSQSSADVDVAGGAGAAAAAGGLDRQVVLADHLHDRPADGPVELVRGTFAVGDDQFRHLRQHPASSAGRCSRSCSGRSASARGSRA